MPLFPNLTGEMSFKGKTHTGLVVSEGAAPAEKLIVDKSEGVKFNYAYGPEGNQNVVLAKGKVVDLGEPAYDQVTSYTYPTIKTAAVGSSNAVGVNHHNLYEVKRDRFSGNQATVITRSYIEVPLFEHADAGTAQSAADAMHYGAAYGTSGDIKPGDYVKVGENGNFVKLDTAEDAPFQIVGQVWGVERELPPAGFLQYYLDMKIDELEAFIKGSSHAPSPGKNDGIEPNGSGDVGAYPFGYPWQLQGWKGDFEDLLNPAINKGIPFLTDGYFKAKTVKTNIAMNDIYDKETNNDGDIESVVFSGGVTFGHESATTPGEFEASADNAVDTGVQVSNETRNNALFIKLRHPIDRVEQGNIVVKADGENVADADVHVDYTNNMVVVYLEPGQTIFELTIDAKLVVDPVAGIPTEWDYAGAVGAVRILLQR